MKRVKVNTMTSGGFHAQGGFGQNPFGQGPFQSSRDDGNTFEGEYEKKDDDDNGGSNNRLN
jgi:UPF0716 protein FxsA